MGTVCSLPGVSVCVGRRKRVFDTTSFLEEKVVVCVNVCVEGAILEGRALCNFLFLFYYTVLYTQDESTWATASSRLQMAEMALLAWVIVVKLYSG